MTIVINILSNLLFGWPAMVLGYFFAALTDGFKAGLWWYAHHDEKTCDFLNGINK